MYNAFDPPIYNPDEFDKVTFHWGIKEILQENRWEQLDSGELIWDDSFTVSTSVNQENILSLCEYLEEYFGNSE